VLCGRKYVSYDPIKAGAVPPELVYVPVLALQIGPSRFPEPLPGLPQRDRIGCQHGIPFDVPFLYLLKKRFCLTQGVFPESVPCFFVVELNTKILRKKKRVIFEDSL
jgi:hypothetical protein